MQHPEVFESVEGAFAPPRRIITPTADRWRPRLLHLTRRAKSRRWFELALRYHPLYRRAPSRAIAAMENADAPARQQLQQALLQRTLAAARKTVYGRNRPDRLSDWPVLDKTTLRADFRNFLAPSMWSVPAATSGSSGMPLRLERSLSNICAEQMFLDSLLAPFGLDFRTARVAVLRGDDIKPPTDSKPPFWVFRNANYLVLSSCHLGASSYLAMCRLLESYQPDVLWIYPSTGNLLASLCERYRSTLHIPVILSSSEMLFKETRERLERVFGSTVIDYYGQAERVCFGWQHHPNEGWFSPAYGHVELRPLPAAGGPAEREAQVIATGFWNPRMPLVRYDTGDRIAYPAHYGEADLQLVALGLKPYLRIVGRATDYLLAPDGRQVFGISQIPREVSNILRIQFVQERLDHVTILVEPLPDFGEADMAHLLRNARMKIPQNMGIGISTNRPLHVTPQQKTPFLIRNIQPPQ